MRQRVLEAREIVPSPTLGTLHPTRPLTTHSQGEPGAFSHELPLGLFHEEIFAENERVHFGVPASRALCPHRFSRGAADALGTDRLCPSQQVRFPPPTLLATQPQARF